MTDERETQLEKQCIDEEVFVAFIDFSASFYALGDILTWIIRVCCEALNSGKKVLDVVALTDPNLLGNKAQPFIDRNAYMRLFLDLVPAFYTNPMLRGFHHLRDRAGFERLMDEAKANNRAMFPGHAKYREGLDTRIAAYNGHTVINRFYREQGFVPRLTTPPGYRLWAESFLKSYSPEAFVVTVHVRQRVAESHIFRDALDRDGDYRVWEEFFDEATRRRPETVFILLGKPAEWPRRLMRRSNVIILKSLGLGLMEELAMIQASDLFMGLLSGPSIMAFFSETPYAQFVQSVCADYTAKLMEIEMGAPRLPFAGEHQTLHWEEPTTEALCRAFEAKLLALRGAGKD